MSPACAALATPRAVRFKTPDAILSRSLGKKYELTDRERSAVARPAPRSASTG